MGHPMQPASLLCLPSELRSKILVHSIGKHKIHITNQGSRICTGEPDVSDKSEALVLLGHDCCKSSGSIPPHFIDLLMVCRLIHDEVKPVLYRHLTLHFTSPAILCDFFGNRPQILPLVHRVHLNCGFAKHLDASAKAVAEHGMTLIADGALRLTYLHLTFRAYYGIEREEIIISEFWRHHICRIKGLSSLSVDFLADLPGPIGVDWTSTKIKDRVETKIRIAAQILRSGLSLPQKSANEPVNDEAESLQSSSEEIVTAKRTLRTLEYWYWASWTFITAPTKTKSGRWYLTVDSWPPSFQHTMYTVMTFQSAGSFEILNVRITCISNAHAILVEYTRKKLAVWRGLLCSSFKSDRLGRRHVGV